MRATLTRPLLTVAWPVFLLPPPHPVCLCPSPFSRWPFLSRFPSRPEHTMATPLEDVGKQVGRSRPLPTALKGLSGAAGHLCSWSLSPPGVAGRPVPGGLHPVPAGPLPGSHGAGARGGHRAGQHPRGHHGADRLLYR